MSAAPVQDAAQAVIGRWRIVGTTGAKTKNKINNLVPLTGCSGALILNGNFWRRPHR